MFSSKTILIIDDNAYAALDLACVVESKGGAVAGPVAAIGEAMAILATQHVDAAIVDGNIPNAATLIRHLHQAALPYLIHAAATLPNDLAAAVDGDAILYRPVDPRMVMAMLAIQIDKADQQRTTPSQPLNIPLA